MWSRSRGSRPTSWGRGRRTSPVATSWVPRRRGGRPRTFEGILRPVRGLAHPITGRGAFKVYAGASEADATIRLLEGASLEAGGEAYVRITTARPLVLDVFDRFVLRESGRQETVGGGSVLDPAPPRRAGRSPESRLARRASAATGRAPRDPRGGARGRAGVGGTPPHGLERRDPSGGGMALPAGLAPGDRSRARPSRQGVPRGSSSRGRECLSPPLAGRSPISSGRRTAGSTPGRSTRCSIASSPTACSYARARRSRCPRARRPNKGATHSCSR